jgi:hypothetical protein
VRPPTLLGTRAGSDSAPHTRTARNMFRTKDICSAPKRAGSSTLPCCACASAGDPHPLLSRTTAARWDPPWCSLDSYIVWLLLIEGPASPAVETRRASGFHRNQRLSRGRAVRQGEPGPGEGAVVDVLDGRCDFKQGDRSFKPHQLTEGSG